FRTYVTAHISGKFTVIRGKGCHLCNNTGYHGRLAIQEVLEIDKALKELILKSMPPLELEQYLKEKEFKSMLYDGLLKAREGITTVEEVLRVV
ncbi:MAG TPA: type II secretion system protein GspE, partial [Bacilli bacterium]